MSQSDLITAPADPTDADGAADEACRMADAVERARLRLEQVQEITAIGMILPRGVADRRQSPRRVVQSVKSLLAVANQPSARDLGRRRVRWFARAAEAPESPEAGVNHRINGD